MMRPQPPPPPPKKHSHPHAPAVLTQPVTVEAATHCTPLHAIRLTGYGGHGTQGPSDCMRHVDSPRPRLLPLLALQHATVLRQEDQQEQAQTQQEQRQQQQQRW